MHMQASILLQIIKIDPAFLARAQFDAAIISVKDSYLAVAEFFDYVE